jgi:hypothetical protein
MESGTVADNRITPIVLPLATAEPFYCFVEGEPAPVFIVRPGHEKEDSNSLVTSFCLSESKVHRLFEIFVSRQVLNHNSLCGDEGAKNLIVQGK